MKLTIEIPWQIKECLNNENEWSALLLTELKDIINNGTPIEQKPKTDKYEYHTDHTDCLWYGGSDSRCPATCSQYRDGWNDAMNYIYKDGKGYHPYRRWKEGE